NTSHLRPRQAKKALNHQISRSGPHEPAAIGAILRKADAFVLCSTLETQSLVLIEALLSGLPCISSSCGGPEDILQDAEQGTLFPVGDKNALVSAMKALYDKGPSSFAARQRRHHYAMDRYGNPEVHLAALYRNLLPNHV
ncbi:MAG: glycosyltransferase, partial [Bacteroidota bacterium]